MGTVTVLTAYGSPLTPVSSLKYLGGVMLVADDNWPAVVSNLIRVGKKWMRLTWLLGKEGADA